jgi:hypothetical protein
MRPLLATRCGWSRERRRAPSGCSAAEDACATNLSRPLCAKWELGPWRFFGCWMLEFGALHPHTVMPLSAHTLGILAQAAAETIGEFPLSERITIYQALGESLSRDAARVAAMDLARILSQAAAMELDFQEQVRARANDG